MSLSRLGRLSVEELVRSLLGEPNGRLSDPAKGELRFGRQGSLSVKVAPHPRAGLWYDFEAGVGGGVSSLAAHLGLADGSGPAGPPAALRPRQRVEPDRAAGAAGLWGRGHRLDSGLPPPLSSWLDARHLWRPQVPLPPGLRWLQRDSGGLLLALAAPAEDWSRAWPSLPPCRAVQRLPLGPEGKGGDKKSLGAMYGAALVLGDPVAGEGGVLVCEGVADGLALASRNVEPVVVVFGTAAMEGGSENGLAGFLAGFGGGVTVWADRDQPSGGVDGRPRRGPAGERAGHRLSRAVAAAGGSCRVVHAGRGCKDVADLAAMTGFGGLEWANYLDLVERMALASPGTPGWELRRVASVIAAQEWDDREVDDEH